MATTTTKLALTKPDGTDLVDIAVLNANADKIDTASGAFICTSTTRPASPWNGQLIFETDTLNVLVYRTSTTSWSIVGGSTISSTPPAGAGNGNFWWDSDNGILYVYYNDGNSAQWVSVMPSQTTIDVANNVIINGAFDFWQRGTSSSTAGYLADRWASQITGGSGYTQSRQALGLDVSQTTTGGEFFYRHQHTAGTNAGDLAVITTKIEDVRTLAGRTATLSFWATADSARSLSVELGQNFGTGGSTTVNAIGVTKLNVTTTLTRYTVTVNIPSIVGRTIGPNSFLEVFLWFSAGSNFNSRTNSLGNQSGAYTFNIWGVELEAGSVATTFRRNGSSIQEELANCQRYYWRSSSADVYGTFGMGIASASNEATLIVPNPVAMRVPATAIESSALAVWDSVTVIGVTSVTLRAGHQTTTSTPVRINVAGNPLPQYRPYFLLNGNNVSGFLGVSAEL